MLVLESSTGSLVKSLYEASNDMAMGIYMDNSLNIYAVFAKTGNDGRIIAYSEGKVWESN